MKVSAVKTYLVQPPGAKAACFVKVETDEGLYGWGEAYTVTAQERALAQLCDDLGAYLIGRDPLHIRHFTHAMYRDVAIKRGGLDFYSALSGLEIALWDIAGKHFGTPVYNLLGGPCRGRIRVYGHLVGSADGLTGPEGLARKAQNTLKHAAGYTAVKFDPFPGPWQTWVERDVERAAIENVAAVREAVGPETDILIEVHRRLAPRHAIHVGKAIERYDPFWFEEPTPSENLDATAEVRQKIDVPVVVGEALYTKHMFREAFDKRAADIVNPDICNVGGLLEMREIASIAEAYAVAVAPHGNNSTTVGLAASLQVAACIPNFLIMEHFAGWDRYAAELATTPLVAKDGYLELPTASGIGIDLDEAALAKYPYTGPRKTSLIGPEDERP
jgi:galactonate dehydratase